MNKSSHLKLNFLIGATLLAIAGPVSVAVAQVTLDPTKMTKIGSVSERYQSFNIEMIEVTGGRFWAPYKKSSEAAPVPADPKPITPAGMDPSMYRYRPPLDLANPHLRKLAAALGPAYMRVSGTWANSTYFDDSEGPHSRHRPQVLEAY